MTIYNEENIREAIRNEVDSIVIENETIENAFLVAGRVQNGQLPAIVLERIKKDGICRISVVKVWSYLSQKNWLKRHHDYWRHLMINASKSM